MSVLTMHDDEIAALGRGRAAQGGDSRSPPVDILEGHRSPTSIHVSPTVTSTARSMRSTTLSTNARRSVAARR